MVASSASLMAAHLAVWMVLHSAGLTAERMVVEMAGTRVEYWVVALDLK